MKKRKIKNTVVTTALAVALLASADKAFAQEWHPNSIQTIESNIKQDNQKYNEKRYDIRWGDYLWGISQATKIDMNTLAQINNISNKNLIIAGNKLYYGTDSNIVTKNPKNNQLNVFQETKYDKSGKVNQVSKNNLTGKEEKNIVENSPSLEKDFNSKKEINNKIIKENKDQIKKIEQKIKDEKANAKKQIQELEKNKKELLAEREKLVKEDEEKNKDEIAEIDKAIKNIDNKIEQIKNDTNKKIESLEGQKDYLETENEKLDAENKDDKETAEEKEEELEENKENDPYEVWKKEQLEKHPDLKEKDLTREQYEIWKKDQDKDDENTNPETPDEEEPGDGEDPDTEEPGDNEEPGDEDQTITTKTLKYETIKTYQGNRPVKETRVKQQGKDGYVKYQGDKEIERVNPVNEIIESLVKTQDAVYEEREVDDLTKPYYNQIIIYRAFARGIPQEVFPTIPEGDKDYNKYRIYKIFESTVSASDAYGKAQDYFTNSLVLGNYGDLDPREEQGAEIIGYEKKMETVKVQDEVWEWK